MCDMCNPKMYDREVYYNSTDDAWYLDIETGEWSDYNDDFIHIQRQINYCPYCGRRLYCKNEKNEIHTECYDDEEDEQLLKQAFGQLNLAIDAYNKSLY